MTKLISITAAGCHCVFTGIVLKNLPECRSKLSFVITVISVCFVLWSLPLYPQSLRQMYLGDFIIQYLVALFSLEIILGVVWPSMELLAVNVPFAAGEFLNCPYILMSREIGQIFSFILGVTILICVLHATGAIDLKLLSGDRGTDVFCCDIKNRLARCREEIEKNIDCVREWYREHSMNEYDTDSPEESDPDENPRN